MYQLLRRMVKSHARRLVPGWNLSRWVQALVAAQGPGEGAQGRDQGDDLLAPDSGLDDAGVGPDGVTRIGDGLASGHG